MTLYWNADGRCRQSPTEPFAEVKPGDVFRFDGDNTYTVVDTLGVHLVALCDDRLRQFHHTRATRVLATTHSLWWRDTTDGTTLSVFADEADSGASRRLVRRGDPVRVNGIGEYTVLDIAAGNTVVVRNEADNDERQVAYGQVTYRDTSRTRDTEEEVDVLGALSAHVGRTALFTIERGVRVDRSGVVSVGCQSANVATVLGLGGSISGGDDGFTLTVPGVISARFVQVGANRMTHGDMRAYASKAMLQPQPSTAKVNCGLGFFICAAHDDHVFLLTKGGDEPIIRMIGAGTVAPVYHGFDAYPDCRPEHHSTIDGSTGAATEFVLVECTPDQLLEDDRV